MYKHFFSILLVLIVTLLSPESKADWINLTGAENTRNIAEIYVEKKYVQIKLEVFVEDLYIFEELIPDQLFSSILPERPEPDKRMQIFADSVLQIITDTGEKLSAELVLVEPRMRIDRPSPLVGSLLNDVYLQSRKSMIIEQAGGAQAKVKQPEVLDVAVKQSSKQKGALDIRTKWTAIGTVGHWGHNHTRQNVYDAILSLVVEDGSWKISEIELLEEKRVDPYK